MALPKEVRGHTIILAKVVISEFSPYEMCWGGVSFSDYPKKEVEEVVRKLKNH